jgi:hypothetical protein
LRRDGDGQPASVAEPVGRSQADGGCSEEGDGTLVEILIIVVVVLIVMAIIWQLPMPVLWKNIALLVVGLIAVVYLLRMLGAVGGLEGID